MSDPLAEVIRRAVPGAPDGAPEDIADAVRALLAAVLRDEEAKWDDGVYPPTSAVAVIDSLRARLGVPE